MNKKKMKKNEKTVAKMTYMVIVATVCMQLISYKILESYLNEKPCFVRVNLLRLALP